MARSLDFTSGDTIGISSSDGATIDDVVYGTAQVWVCFTSVTTTTITDSYNVTSLTDNGTGDTTINFTNALPNANYAVAGKGIATAATTITTNLAVAGTAAGGATTKSTTALRVLNAGTASAVDAADVSVAIFGSRA